MVDRDTAFSIKAAFLEQRREVFVSIFKGLVQDQYTVIQKVLQVCWEAVWSDPKIKRTTKLGLFNEVTISHVSPTRFLWHSSRILRNALASESV